MPVGLYYVQDVQLVRVARLVPTPNELLPLDLRVALSELERGPQPEEGADLRTALPVAQVLDVQTSRGVAIVALAPTFRDIPDQQLAVAQIVLTLTERGVGQVQFTIDGELIQVPKADLSQTADPVVREDYAALVVEAGRTRSRSRHVLHAGGDAADLGGRRLARGQPRQTGQGRSGASRSRAGGRR